MGDLRDILLAGLVAAQERDALASKPYSWSSYGSGLGLGLGSSWSAGTGIMGFDLPVGAVVVLGYMERLVTGYCAYYRILPIALLGSFRPIWTTPYEGALYCVDGSSCVPFPPGPPVSSHSLLA